jgi:membrane protein required for colicin V production
MNWLDAVIFLILIIPTFIGFKRGLAKTALPLLGIVSGVVLAGVFHGHMADWLSSWLKSPNQAKVAAFLIIFVLFIIVGLLLFWLLRKSLRLFRFGWGGLTSTVLPLVGILLGLALAGLFYGAMADSLSSWLESRSQATIIAFLIIFIVVVVASIELYLILSSLGKKRPKVPLAGWADRLGGVILGLAIGGVISGAILSLIARYSSPGMEATISDSSLAAFFLDQFPFVLHLLPEEFDTVHNFFGGGG